jgi:Spy/CpxP family protein refolding chaperone
MMKPTRLAALYLAAVFVAGTLFGFVAHGFYSERTARASNPKEFRERVIARFTKDLSLSTEQVTEVTAILDQTHDRFQGIRDRMEPEFDALREAQRQRIMALLTPEQQPKYQKLLEERRQRHPKKAPGK